MIAPRPRAAFLAALLTGALLAGACQSGAGRERPAAVGPVTPTVAGRVEVAYADAAAAKEAFTRQTADGFFTAVLEDVAWLRYQGSPEEVEAAHPAYFEQGYTTFQVVLLTEGFTQPTRESFLLEDSQGQRVSSSPIKYTSQLGTVGKRFAYEFSLSFKHAITSETRWVRLARPGDGLTLEWHFP